MLDTCLSRDMSEDMMKPRSRAWEEKEIVAEPTCIDCGRVDKDRSDFLNSVTDLAAQRQRLPRCSL